MNTPVLLLVYNRQKTTKLVLERLAECGMTNVHVSADGPKNKADQVQTEAVRECISNYTNIIQESRFENNNKGCKTALLNGINWFFSKFEEGIILEDDCLPNDAFFKFTTEQLDMYRNEPRVQMISGNNPLGNWACEDGHFFSRIGHIWGWATWKNRWEKFDPELPDLDSFVRRNGFERKFGPTSLARSRKQLTSQSVEGKIDTWDYQWNAHILMSGGFAVIPEKNLIENIGFDALSTHTDQKPTWIPNVATKDESEFSVRQPRPEREYEMELFLAQLSNESGLPSSFPFQKKAKAESRKLKVIGINSTDLGGGAEKIALTIHERLLELGHDSMLFVSIKKSDLKLVQELNSDWKQQILNTDPDIIHIHNLHGTPIPLHEIAELSWSNNVVFTLHDSWLTTGSNEHPFKLNIDEQNLLELKAWRDELRARKLAISNSKIRWTAPSQWMRERFFSTHGIRSYFVPNGIDPAEPVTIEISSARFILFVANQPETNLYKDYATLRKAWIKANQILEKDGCGLICIGANGQSISEHGGFRLHIMERLNAAKVQAFMNHALLVIQPSMQDNSPLTILEAHSCGKRVVASLIGGIPEMVEENEESWLYEAQNSEDLANRIVEAIQFTDSGQHPLGNAKICTVESMVDMYLGHYHDLVNG